jgi:hypothetical protein
MPVLVSIVFSFQGETSKTGAGFSNCGQKNSLPKEAITIVQNILVHAVDSVRNAAFQVTYFVFVDNGVLPKLVQHRDNGRSQFHNLSFAVEGSEFAESITHCFMVILIALTLNVVRTNSLN